MAQTAAAPRLQDAHPALEARALSKTVFEAGSSLTIIDDVNLTVATGQTVAVLGASGSGKSTLLGLLAGLDVPSSGSVRLLGEELFALDEDGRARVRARSVGFVFQSFQLLPHLTALENVMLPLELGAGTVPPGRFTGVAADLLDRVGLRERLMHYPTTLSGGEQQRVALARAFVTRPAVLMADEPTGSLDERTGAVIAELLFELNREAGSTLILVTHDPILASRCTRRILLQAGRIQADS
ncbi:MAG TPA: ABC transporter ATP-binding protein [Burkholderiaceae bacterium]|nr:ABC transporter ATP-binding protein [Burkholderiaceae bacterium]